MNIAINGFGRIGRVFFRQAFGHDDFNIVAVNDLGDADNLLYLLKYDSVYRRFDKEAKREGDGFSIGGNHVRFLQEKDPSQLPWKEMRVDVVVESTGFFTSYEKAKAHLDAGAKRVVISAPAKDDGETKTATPNVGIDFLKEGQISSNASCTTNATTPVMSIMMKSLGVKKAVLSTVHGYTATQALVDGPQTKDFTRGRAAAMNIVPSHTGAANAVEKAIPETKGKFDGISMRVPVIAGSIIDFTFLSEKKTTVGEVNDILRKAAGSKEWKGIIHVTDEPLVSSDVLGQPFGSIVEPSFTRVVDGDLVKILSWYDNEWGYCAMLIKHIESLRSLL
ncbi:MAG: type I glyceraldehyde-3-phosphate dehydrogenase [Candidatus Niyogibacteria bacterium CG10_big_fil_rev_8_21_14_0_10_46_36]|uniref:Type I glyceraldehyde-3-phosphate dehydrogenase n=1 Tax=Candidatus Niyogibacteria bacterium CG10_big_fil_rev_8_21_14_0_10_46_36 TaxID=1974726 RepID=A0A2H0TD83_9BACT|nr:MAG: type I glyceraldehyde-3-phosphate dehydrogenase [Candidatus Niyogibacteria bacterium CG10_big_fil_rev_8_21_14_0_10_46_36]